MTQEEYLKKQEEIMQKNYEALKSHGECVFYSKDILKGTCFEKMAKQYEPFIEESEEEKKYQEWKKSLQEVYKQLSIPARFFGDYMFNPYYPDCLQMGFDLRLAYFGKREDVNYGK